MNNDLQDFQTFMKQRDEVAQAYVNGDAAPLGEIVTHDNPATFFAPFGGYLQGADAVAMRYAHDANSFTPEGKSRLEILQMGASEGIAYWVGIQHATAQLKDSPDPIPMNLRITELFRREGQEWKLIHRHADTLVSAPEKKKA